MSDKISQMRKLDLMQSLKNPPSLFNGIICYQGLNDRYYESKFLLYGTHAVMSLKINSARTVDNKSL